MPYVYFSITPITIMIAHTDLLQRGIEGLNPLEGP